jgi:hypothetical protein
MDLHKRPDENSSALPTGALRTPDSWINDATWSNQEATRPLGWH